MILWNACRGIIINNMKFLSQIFKYKNNCEVIGLTDELNAFYVLNKYNKDNKNMLVVADTLYKANLFYEKLTNYTDRVLLFPMDDFITSVAVAISPELKLKRLETLKLITSSKNYIVITNLMGYLRYLTNVDDVNKLGINIKKDISINRDSLINYLIIYYLLFNIY